LLYTLFWSRLIITICGFWICSQQNEQNRLKSDRVRLQSYLGQLYFAASIHLHSLSLAGHIFSFVLPIHQLHLPKKTSNNGHHYIYEFQLIHVQMNHLNEPHILFDEQVNAWETLMHKLKADWPNFWALEWKPSEILLNLF